MDSPLRLIASNPLDQLARTLEALLVVASAPLTVEELAAAADDNTERIEAALGLVRERYSEGRSGIVREHVASGCTKSPRSEPRSFPVCSVERLNDCNLLESRLLNLWGLTPRSGV